MKKLFPFLLLALTVKIAGAQISQGGTPLSWSGMNASVLSMVVPFDTLPFVDVQALREEDVIVDQIKDIPWRFGEKAMITRNMKNSGRWDVLSDGSRVWRTGVFSDGALTLNLIFSKFYMPYGAKFYIYSPDHSRLFGAYTQENNQPDSIFATTLIPGDAVILEYYEPAGVYNQGVLELESVTHGYRGVEEFLKAFGDAGSCNKNVACPEASGWESEIRSVCVLLTSGTAFCTGALINNTNNDGTPYVLTANHCYSTPSSWVFWFNWQSSTCTNPSSSPSYNSISGATLRARNAASDFCLVQINSSIPGTFNHYFSGWNRTTNASVTGTITGIHHPSGDIKKFSYTTLGVSTTSYLGSSSPGDNSHWRITSWSGGTTTEGGSSGSPLYDPNHLIIGQLHGGYAACGNTDSDWYGKLGVSWTGGGTSSSRLSDWLDPAGTGANTLIGYDPSGPQKPVAQFSATPQSSCTGDISFTDQSTNTPNSWHWNFGDGGTSTLQNPTHSYTLNGVYSVKLVVANASGSDSLTRTSYITINMPLAPSVIGDTVCNPGVAHLSASGSGILKWYSAPTGGTLLQTGNNFNTPSLSSTTQYYVEDSVAATPVHAAKPDSVGGSSIYSGATVHYLVFDCYVPLTLQTVKIYTNTAQTNKVIRLQNASGVDISTATVNLSSGINTVTLNFSLPADTGLRLVGPASPAWVRSYGGISYPYTLPGKLSIKRSSAAPTVRYYFFYDWVVKERDCVSPRSTVTAWVVNCSGLEEAGSFVLEVSPNPADSKLYIEIRNPGHHPVSLEMLDLCGRRVYSEELGVLPDRFRNHIDVSSFSTGTYFLKIQSEKGTSVQKIVIR